MSENIYAPPQSKLEVKHEANALASRWKRLFASLLDSLTIMAVTLPAMYFTGGFDGFSTGVPPNEGYMLLMSTLGMLIFFVINGSLLIKNGQTIGKRVVGIKIVDLDGRLPTLKGHLIKRYATFTLPGFIPVAGQFLSLINIVFIFGKQKRCVHDYAGGTKVVSV